MLKQKHIDLLYLINKANLDEPTMDASTIREKATLRQITHRPKVTELTRVAEAAERRRSKKKEGTHSRNISTSPEESIGHLAVARTVRTRFVDLHDFEDLYYVTCITLSDLYYDVQSRHLSGFLPMTTVIHNGGANGTSQGAFLFKDFAADLHDKWQKLMDPKLVSALNMAVMKHNYRRLIQEPLLPDHDPSDWRPEHDLILKANLQRRYLIDPRQLQDACMLHDMSTTNPVELVDRIYKKHRIMHYAAAAAAATAQGEEINNKQDQQQEQPKQRERSRKRAELGLNVDGSLDYTYPATAPPCKLSFFCDCQDACHCRPVCIVSPNE